MLVDVWKSRLFYIIIAILSDYLIPDHEASGVEVVPSSQFSNSYLRPLLVPFSKWDSAHYLKLSSSMYDNEYQFVFFPVYPKALDIGSKIISYVLSTFFGIILTKTESTVIGGLLINTLSFSVSYYALELLLSEIMGLKRSGEIVKRSLMIFCWLNPATIFFSTLYTESFYSCFSWMGLYLILLTLKKKNKKRRSHVIKDVIPSLIGISCLVIASSTRSNGFTNIITIVVFFWLQSSSSSCGIMSWLLLCLSTIACISPYFIWNFVTFRFLCVMDNKDIDTIDFCQSNYSSSNGYLPIMTYNYLQSKYWGVGFMNSFEWKQLPNILLACPIVFITITFIRSTTIVRDRLFQPFLISLIVILMMGVLFAHIQITTRLICSSCPIIYIALASLSLSNENKLFIFVYLILFSIGGTILHVNFFPWT